MSERCLETYVVNNDPPALTEDSLVARTLVYHGKNRLGKCSTCHRVQVHNKLRVCSRVRSRSKSRSQAAGKSFSKVHNRVAQRPTLAGIMYTL